MITQSSKIYRTHCNKPCMNPIDRIAVPTITIYCTKILMCKGVCDSEGDGCDDICSSHSD